MYEYRVLIKSRYGTGWVVRDKEGTPALWPTFEAADEWARNTSCSFKLTAKIVILNSEGGPVVVRRPHVCVCPARYLP
jgi:hypothetical protein